MKLIDADKLMEYCLNQKTKTIDCNDIARFPLVDGVSKATVKELMWSGRSLDTDADKEYVCGLIDELEG